MEQRILNGTGLKVSRICLGTMTFGGQTDRAAAREMLSLAFGAGVNFVDTANVYAGGESERILGELLGERRHEIVLASKVGMKVGEETPGLSSSAIISAVENSLARLRTDYLDICYLHMPDYGVPLEETLAAMDQLVRQGKVRHAASSNFASWQVCHMLCLAEKHGYAPVRISQPMYNLLARRIEDEFLPACRQFGVATVVYNPLAGGLLTGKHNNTPEPGSRFDGNRVYLDRYWNEAALRTVERLSAAAGAAARSLVSVALNWLLHHTPIDGVILGVSRVEHLTQNLHALRDGPIDPTTLAVCDGAWQTLKGAGPKYNR